MKRCALTLLPLLALLVASPLVHAQAVARVIMSAGDVSAVRSGANVPLGAGAEIQNGDQVRTGAESYAQLRFADGAIFALRSETEFRVEDFRYGGVADGTERAFFNLLKGGFRTVTGLVGKLNQRNYRVVTPTSTIGIRGTHFNLVQCDGGCRGNDGTPAPVGTYGGVSDGRIAATPLNNPTERQFGAGEFFYVANANTPAAPLIAPPGFLTDKLSAQSRSGGGQQQQAGQGGEGQPQGTQGSQAAQSSGIGADGRAQGSTLQATLPVTYSSTELKNSSGTSTVVSSYVPTGFVVVGSALPTSISVLGDNGQGNFTYNADGQLLTFGPTSSGTTLSLNGGAISDTGSAKLADGTEFRWGVWTGNTLIQSSSGTFTGVPVLFGSATNTKSGQPSSAVVQYDYLAGPRPRDAAGNLGTVTSSKAFVDFARQSFNVNMLLDFAAIGNSGSASFNASGSGTKATSSNSLDFSGSLFASCTGTGCQSGSSSGTVNFGTGGSNGYSLGVAGGGLLNATKGGTVTFLNGYSGSLASGLRAVSVVSNTSFGVIPLAMEEPSAQLAFGPAGFTAFSLSSTFSGNQNSGLIVEAGSNAAANMFWGRWTGAAVQVTVSGNTLSNPTGGVPFVGGDRLDAMPTSGSAVYNYVGGPNPVSLGGSVGSFSGGAFGVNFATRAISVATPLSLTVGPNTFSLSNCASGCTYSSSSATFSAMGLTGTCTGGCSIATANVSGVFLGTQARALATSGTVNGGASTVLFSAGFAR